MIRVILIGVVILLAVLNASVLLKNISKQQKSLPPLKTGWKFDKFHFIAHEDSPTVWRTDIYIGNSEDKAFTLDGYYLRSKIQKLDQSKTKYLEIILVSGKLSNSKLFKDTGDKLERVPISEEIWSYFDPEYRDIDNDGVKEMLVYHTPGGAFDRPRTVEVFRFDSQEFKKQREYQEL